MERDSEEICSREWENDKSGCTSDEIFEVEEETRGRGRAHSKLLLFPSPPVFFSKISVIPYQVRIMHPSL